MTSCKAAVQGGAYLGLLSWALYWNRGEHTLWTARYLGLAVIFPALGAIGASIVFRISRQYALQLSLVAETAYILSIWLNMLVYRAFFHPLHHFPGPFTWKLSKFVQSFRNRNLQNYKIVHQLHMKYGDYVRTGPTELHIVDPDAPTIILNGQTRCDRGPWYEMSLPLRSLIELRDRRRHDSRRKVWNRAFNAKALRDYAPRVDKSVDLLALKIADRLGRPLDVSKWMSYFAFDVMGELAFARSFEMLETGRRHEVFDMLEKGQQSVGFLGMLPWLFHVITKIPGLNSDYKKWLAFCEDLIVARQKMKVDRPDIAHWLLDYHASGYTSAGPEEDREWLRGDSRLIVVAGSDTTTSVATFGLYHLCKDARQSERIRRELANLEHTSMNTFNDLALQNDCPYLNAFINEVLRLHPPVPGGFQRQTPAEGVTITSSEDPSKRVWIPGGINVWMPIWTLGRSAQCYSQPLVFAPERWLPEQSEYVAQSSPKLLRKDAYIPFSSGPMNCVGKGLAMQELRSVFAVLLDRFELSFSPGEDGRALCEESKDFFSIGVAPFLVTFTRRKC